MNIHPLAIVSPQAQIGRDVCIGPFSVVEADVMIGDGCRLEAHVVVKDGTRLGPGNTVHEGVVLGGLPQHVHKPDRPGLLQIGRGNTLREFVTIHRAMKDGFATTIGDGNYLMVGSHVAHDCHVANHVIFANYVLLAGHVAVDDRAFLSGGVGVHQFCRVGRFAMVGGHAKVVQDVPPFVTIDGTTSCVVGLNLVGLRRGGFSNDEINQLKSAYRLIYRSGLKWTEVVERLRAEFPGAPASALHEFFATGTRGFVQERRSPPGATIIKLRPQADEAAEAPAPLKLRAG